MAPSAKVLTRSSSPDEIALHIYDQDWEHLGSVVLHFQQYHVKAAWDRPGKSPSDSSPSIRQRYTSRNGLAPVFDSFEIFFAATVRQRIAEEQEIDLWMVKFPTARSEMLTRKHEKGELPWQQTTDE